MCDCFHLAFPNWHADSSGTGAGRRLRAAEPGTEDDSVAEEEEMLFRQMKNCRTESDTNTCDEPSQFTERERPRPQGSSPVEEYPETEKYTDSDKECEAEHDLHHKSGSGKKTKKSGLGSMFEKRSTPKMSKLKEVHSPESGVIVKTAKDGCAEGLVYGGGGKDGIFIKEVVPESPASKSLKLKEGDQVLSATVYFDNMSYEDAIQILEHAQAYKVKLCLKRKPDITETEPAIESDVIPEEDVYAPEIREQGKTNRRGDARISWPKFPSFGKGRKSRFTRSHSSSEADEQRKLELSPTTSDTESPIKSQDALKGKKKHKVKLSIMTKRGRISSSEDHDTDAATSAQMLSPECLESPSGETPQVYVTEDLNAVQDLQNYQKLTEPQTVQHKVELITIDSTLKTEDLTVALAGQESPSGIKSPDGKKKKKERSELKMKILAKDKLHKKDAKAKSSPKRLKTLGASFEIADQAENEKSDVIPSFESHTKQGDQLPLDANAQIISKSVTTQMEMSVPKVDLEISDVAVIQKSPWKGEEKAKKTKTGPTFKLPKIGFSDIDTEEIIPKMNVNVEECTTEIELTTEGTEVKEDPYDRLSKSSRSRTKLPKREDIEIPGMEDMSKRTTAKGIKEPKAVFTGYDEDIQAETVQLSIDVDSVKEAVSKLPGFKLPKVDTSGVPIPEEITVIDANAQRISVKTPTKTKHEAHFNKFDVTASPEISKTTIKIPKITPADLTSEEVLMETWVDTKIPEKKYKTEPKQSDGLVYKREHIIIPGKESAQEVAILQTQETQGTEGIKSEYESTAAFKSKKTKITMPSFGIAKPDIRIPDIGIDLPKQNISEQKGVKGERTILLQEVEMSKTETRNMIGGVISDVKIPEIDGIEYIDSVDGSPAKKHGDIKLTGFRINLDTESPKADISFPEIRGEVKDVEAKEHTFKLPKFGAVTPNISVKLPDADKDINVDGAEIEKGGKFKMPNVSMPKVKGPKIDLSLSKQDVDVTLPEAKAEIELPDVPEGDISLGNVDVSIPEKKMEVEKPELEIKPWRAEGELDEQGGKFKMPKLGFKMPKLKGPEFDLSLSKKDIDVTLPEAKAEVKLPKAPETDVTLGNVDVSIPEQKMEFEKPELEIKPWKAEGELDEQGGKFKMPKLGFKMPKLKGPEFDFSLSKKDVDVTIPEAKAEVNFPEATETDLSLGNVDVSIPEQKMEFEKPELEIKPWKAEGELDEEGGKFKMPKLGFKMPKLKGPEFDFSLSKKDVDVTIPEAKAEVNFPEATEIDVTLGNADVSISEQKMEFEKPELEIKPLRTEGELDGQGSKFKMPKFGVKIPKIKGPEFDVSLSKKDVDVTLPEAEVKIPDAEHREPSIKVEAKAPEITVHQQNVKGSPSKFNMPTFKLPTFGISTPKVSVEDRDMDKDVKIDGADINIPVIDIEAPSIDVEGPSIDMKTTGTEHEGKGSKFKMPHLGFSMPKVKGPQLNLSSSKKDVDVTLPEVNAEVKLQEAPKIEASLGKAEVLIPEATVEVKKPEVRIQPLQTDIELEGQGGKFQMPKFGITMPKVKGPELHFGLSKKDGDVTLPEAKVEVKVPDPTKVDVSLGKADVSLTQGKIEVEKPELEIKPLQSEVEFDGQGSKFKMPKLGMSMPKVKGPEIHFGLSKKDGDVTLPEAKAEVKVPEVELKEPSAKVEVKAPEIKVATKGTVGSPTKFKMPTFKLPKFGVGTPNVSVEVPDMDKDVKIDGADITIPDEGSVHIAAPSIDIEGPTIDMKTSAIEQDGKGSKFKMPHLGFSMPKVKGPKTDFSLSKKDVDVTLPEAKTDVKLPGVDLGKVDVSIPEAEAELKLPEATKIAVEMKPPEAELEGHGGKFKMPKFGMSMPKVKGPEFHLGFSKKDVDVTLPEAKADVSLPEVELHEPSAKVEIKGPEIEVAAKNTEGSPSKFKMPNLSFSMPKMKGPNIDLSLSKKDRDITLPRTKAEIKTPKIDASLGKAEVFIPEAKMEVKKPEVEIKPVQTGTELEEHESKFQMPRFGITMPKVKGPEFDLSFSKKDVNVTQPEAKAEVELPEAPKIVVDMKPPECEAEIDGQGSKFKMPKFGISMPKVKGPEIDFNFSKKDVDVTFPDAEAEVKIPDAELKQPSAKVEIKAPEIEAQLGHVEGSPSKSKLPTFKFPKFGVALPNISAEVPDMDKDIKVEGVGLKIPKDGATVETAAQNIDIEGPSLNVKMKVPEGEGKESKFKVPKFGISLPKIQGPEFDLSLSKKDVDVKLPKAEAEAKFLEGPEIDVNLGKVDVSIPEAKMEVKKPELEIKALQSEGELDGQGHKFHMPKFGISMPKVKGPEIDFSLSKKDAHITLPEAKAEVSVPDVELKEPSAKVEIKAPEIEAELSNVKGSPSKFKLPTFKFPKFGAATPDVSADVPGIDKEIKIDGADMHISLPHTDVDVSEVKAEVHLPEVEVKKPSGSVVIETQPGVEVDAKLKKPRFSLPKFSFSKPSVKAPEVDASLQDVNVAIPEGKVEVKGGEVDIKIPEYEAEVDGQGSKFKMPKFGITMPKVSGPEIDLSLSKKDVDVTLPEAKAEVQFPDVKIKQPSATVEIKAPEIEAQTGHVDGSPAKLKMPTFTLPKFGAATPKVSVEVPDVDKDITIDGATVDVTAPSIDTEGLSVDMKAKESELEGSGSKFKMPKFGISMPKVKGPEIDLSLSKKDVEVTLPEAKAEVKLPDAGLKEPSAELEIKAPEIKVERKGKDGSPSKFKMPSFKLPKFGVGTPSATIEVPDRGVKIDGADIDIPEEVLTVDIAAPSIESEGPSIDIKTTGAEHEGKGSKFKLPSLGFSGPQFKRPDIDLSLSNKDIDVTLPEAKAEVKLPDVELKESSTKVEIKAPGIDVQTSNVEGSPSKLKMPTFKLPKFGAATPQVSVEVPDVDKDITLDGADLKLPEAKAEVKLPDIEIKEPVGSISVSQAPEGDAMLKKTSWTLPKFSFSKTSVKASEADVNLDLPKVDVTLPEAKTDIHVPDIDIKQSSGISIEGAPATDLDVKLKKPRFSLPKFSFSRQGSKESKVDVSLPDVDVSLPEGNVEVKQPEVELKPPEGDVELEGQESKLKLPKFGISMPKVKGPEIDLSLSKKDVDVTLPEAKAEVELPDVKIKQPSATVEIKAPEIEAQTGHVDGSPAKLKMPTFTLPKFGAATPKVSVEVPDVDKDITIDGATVDVTAPGIDTEGLSVDVKAKGGELEGSGSKFKLPKFGISMPKVKGPEIDMSLSKKDVEVTLPEAKAEVKLPDVELKESSAKVEIKAPGIDVQTSNVEGSPSKLKMPTFKLPKFGAATPQVSVEVPDVDKDITLDGADLKLPEAKAEVKLPDIEIKEPVGSISVSQAPVIEGDATLKKTSWTLPKFSFSKTSVKAPEADVNLDLPKVDVTLPEAKTDIHVPDIDIKQSSGISIEGAPATDLDVKLKKPRFSLPKFSFSRQGSKESKVDVSLPDIDVSLPEGNVEVKQPEVELKPPEGDVELEGQESKLKLPKFGISMPKVKGPEIDLSLSKKDVDVTLPEAKAEVELPDVKIKPPSATVEIKAPEIEAQTGHVDGSPAKFKMPAFTLPKFGAATPKVSVEVPDVDKDITIDGATVDVTAPSTDTDGLSVDVKAKESELEGSGSKFKIPKFGISVPKVKGPEIDMSLSKKDVDVTLPEVTAEVKLPDVEVKEPEGAISVPDAPTVEAEAKIKRSNWTFPKFSFSRTGGKAPDVDVNVEASKVDVTSPEAKAEVKGLSGAISMEEPSPAELDANLKKTKFSLPRFSFTKSSVKEPEVSAELPRVDVSLPEGEVIVKQPEMKIKVHELEAEHDGQESKFKLPKFGIALPKVKGPEEDLNASQKDVGITLPEVKTEVKLPETEVKESSASVEIKASETEAKSKNVGGSPLKFKMPTLKMPKFGGATHDVTVEAPEPDKVAETDGAKLKENVTVNIKGPTVDVKTDESKAAVTDSETPKTETDSVGVASPSKFKLPSFKMPVLSFSSTNPEEEHVPVDTECKEDQLKMEAEPKEESKSPKMTLTSFGEIFKKIDVEFDVPKTGENLETSKEVHETDEPSGQQPEAKEKETKQDTIKSPERTGWFKFPRFGLSSPSEPAKISEKDEHKDDKSQAGETADEEISPTCSVQSSDAFADISSAMTSEHVGLSLSSPTKVTVKYSDPNAATGLGETHSKIITSTTRTELISAEPNLPEKITILSSGVSSSSEDTVRLESGKIHVITTNIQATPEAQHAKLLTAVQVQSAGGLPLESEANEAASWTVKDSHSGKKTVFERHLVRETSSERSESKETIVITKQITRMFESSEPISGETASSIQRLKDSVHSEKMRFFDEADK